MTVFGQPVHEIPPFVFGCAFALATAWQAYRALKPEPKARWWGHSADSGRIPVTRFGYIGVMLLFASGTAAMFASSLGQSLERPLWWLIIGTGFAAAAMGHRLDRRLHRL
jgi:hypothetical protein